MGWANPTLVGELTPLPAQVLVGICTTAHNNDGLTDPVGFYYDTVHYADYATAWARPVNAVLSVGRSGQNFTISWTPDGGTLQHSPALGPNADWQPVANPTNPMTVTIGTVNQFYRIKY
jgi:hypothetical protein